VNKTKHAIVKGKKRNQENRKCELNSVRIRSNHHAQDHDHADYEVFQPVKEDQVKTFPSPLKNSVDWYCIKKYKKTDKNWLADSKLHINFIKKG
jgi:hypothetical protein